ncbi:KDM3 [Lepeophtheirus salmonis]|uniref:KDM3 n=1 Tax=Lepeophtheirus salmonis TaxID=72036 RepID=A0A7R8CAJ0_LEPSM|nr:KDM3 [Lepeophtheirus salmonis]CAF2749198.1 KDM3 [Lepeophtheirus salmonis]
MIQNGPWTGSTKIKKDYKGDQGYEGKDPKERQEVYLNLGYRQLQEQNHQAGAFEIMVFGARVEIVMSNVFIDHKNLRPSWSEEVSGMREFIFILLYVKVNGTHYLEEYEFGIEPWTFQQDGTPLNTAMIMQD